MKSINELRLSYKSTGTAFLFWFFLAAHYAYIGKWGVQLLFWVTFGGLGIWAFIDIFRMSGIIRRYNQKIDKEIKIIESLNK